MKHKIKLPDEFQESEVEVEIQRIETEQKALGAKPLTKREIAKVGECLTDFETIYSYLSDIDHISSMGLAEYVSVDSLSKVATLRYGTAPLPMQYAFLWNSSILLRCLALVSTIIQKDPPGTFGELAGRHDKLWDKYVVSSNSAS